MKKNSLTRYLVIVLSLLLCMGAAAFAVTAAVSDPAVMYNGRTGSIVFERALPFLNNTDPDLFPSLKGMMPGDSVTQQIEIGAKNMNGLTIARMHLRAENPNEDYIKLTETYGHFVDFTVSYNGEEITGDLADGVLLGTFYTDEKRTVDVTLSIDINADNNLQALVAEIDWVFIAEVLPIVLPPVDPDDPEPDDPIIPTPDVNAPDLPWLTDEHVNYIIGYDDGLVRPDATITRAEVVTIFYRLLTEEARNVIWSSENIYPDVSEDSWYYIAICTLTNGGFVEGYPNGTFKPDQPITRAELAAIISRFDTKFGQIEITAGFEDAEGHWAEPYVEFAATRGYVIGYPDGTFRPDQAITRAETVTMVNRCLERGVDDAGLMDGYITWPDNLAEAWYYYDIIEAANYHSYDRSDRAVPYQDYNYENWTAIQKPIDWKTHERQWLRELIR